MADEERTYLGNKDQVTEIQDNDTFIITTGDGIRRMTKDQVMKKLGIINLSDDDGGNLKLGRDFSDTYSKKKLKQIRTENNVYITADKVELDGTVLKFYKSMTPPETSDTLVYSVDLVDLQIKDTKYTMDYDVETGLLTLLADGEVTSEATIISGSGSNTGSSSVVKLSNQNGTSIMAFAAGRPVELKFSFTSTEDDLVTGNGTCQITVNGIAKANFNIAQGLTVLDVAEYLSPGTNTVRVKVTDVYGSSRTIVYTISIVDLYLLSNFDATIPYNGDITFKYTPYGAIEKTIHILVDGIEINSIATATSGKQITQILPAMTHGVHRLEVYMDAKLDGESLESEHLIYEILCVVTDETTPMISSVCTRKTARQGEQISIPYIVLDPTRLACDISLDVYTINNGHEMIYSTQSLTVDRSQQYWNLRRYPVGEVHYRIQYGEIKKEHVITVLESDIKIEVKENDLELYLTSESRSNNEANPALWDYKGYTTHFSGFNWRSNGWMTDENGDTCLRLNNNARAEIQFKPFANDIRTFGRTIELEFAIRDANSRDDVVISCMSGGIGFEVKADTACLTSEQSKVFCKYKDEEKVKLAFAIEARSEYKTISVYLNGIQSDVIQYPDNDNFQQTDAVNISIGSAQCGIDLYTVRAYNTALTAVDNVNNFLADMGDIVEKTEAYERNDIYDEYDNISFEKCKERNSVMVIVGDLPQSKGDKKKVKIQYYDIDDSTIDYLDESVTIDIQGTSSQYFVRKNWKLKFSTEHYIDKNHLPAKVICIKVDYAEATGTHNTQNANFVETLYSEQIPPQSEEPKCRTTIYGKPILLFHQKDDNSVPVFYGKANYNYDKGAESVFGFTSDYDVECWEFKNNTSAACNFLEPVVENKWNEDFEARYPEDNTQFDRFRAMHSWVVSTRQDAATNTVLASPFTDSDGIMHTNDTAAYRLAKFKTEFESHFDMHYALIYYVYTFFALMVDQRAKNMFLTYWAKTGKWQPWFYDNDTCFGINNEGQLVFDYYHEDTDQLDGANVYNGQNSVLWVNFREAFSDKIKETYQNLRNNGLITYDKMINQFITNGSDKWSESIYNEDGDFKYISMLRSDNDATNLPQVRGSGKEHFRYFIENRLNYCDSKWYASDYADDYVSLRIYTPETWSGVEPNPAITVTPFSDMYAGVRYKANGTLYQKRAQHGIPVTFRPQGESFESESNEAFNDTETAIYGAHQLSSIGDLAPLYCGSINIAKADKIIELKAGDSTEGYSNGNLRELSVGTNKRLKKINVCNCPNFAVVLDLGNCPSIEEVYATGTAITGVNFPESGVLRIAHLPNTIANFTLKHQLYVETLTFAGYDNIKTLWIENCPTINGLDILEKAKNVNRLRLTDVNLSYNTASEMIALAQRPIAGIDENGVNTDTMWIDGRCHIDTLTGEEYKQIKELYPYLEVTYTTLTSQLIYMSEDGSTELYRETIQNGGNGTYAGETPTKESTAQYDFTHNGWSLKSGGDADPNALKNVKADRKVYAAYSKKIRSYTVRFFNHDGIELPESPVTVEYGSDAKYTGATPTNNSTGNTSDFEFIGWKPEPTNIQGDTSCYAQYSDMRIILDSWDTIKSNCFNGTSVDRYPIGAWKPVYIGAKQLPVSFYQGNAVVYNNEEIHLIGSAAASTMHYKWNGTEWLKLDVLPVRPIRNTAVVYKDEIHVMSVNSNGTYDHYKWDGTSEWTKVSTTPVKEAAAVVYRNEIHLIGGASGTETSHHKWDGEQWTEVSTLPYKYSEGFTLVYNDELHILGGTTTAVDKRAHYKWDGEQWTEVSTLPYNFKRSCAVVYNGEIHLIGGSDTVDVRTNHYKWDGEQWTEVSVLPFYYYDGYSVVYNDAIYSIGGASDQNIFYCYSSETSEWMPPGTTEIIPVEVAARNHDELPDGVNKWEKASDLPYAFYKGTALVYNDELHILGGNGSPTKHSKWNGAEWSEVSTLPNDNLIESGSSIVYNNCIHVFGGQYGKTSHYKWDGEQWTEVSVLPYDALDSSPVIYNNELHLLGGNKSLNKTFHYKWNDSSPGWVSMSTLPENAASTALVCNDEIHLFYQASQKHYIWNDTEWVVGASIPFEASFGHFLVYENAIHVLCGASGSYMRKHYKLEDGEWVEVSTVVGLHRYGSFVVYNGEIHVLGDAYQSSYSKIHYKWSVANWENFETLPNSINCQDNGLIYVRNNDLYVLSKDTLHKWDGEEWSITTNTPSNGNWIACIYNGDIYAYKYTNDSEDEYYKKLFRYDWADWNEVCEIPTPGYGSSLVEYSGNLHIMGGNYGSSSHYKWDGTEWTQDVDLLSTIGYCTATVYNDELHLFNGKVHHKFDGTAWFALENPIWSNTSSFSNSPSYITIHKDRLYVKTNEYIYMYDGTEWSEVMSPGYDIKASGIVSFRGKLHLIGGYSPSVYKNHYVLKNPRATLTFIAKNLLAEDMPFNQTKNNTGGWAISDLRDVLNGEFFETLPQSLRDSITDVQKMSDTGYCSDITVAPSNDKIWIPSISEVFGNADINGYYDNTLQGQGEEYCIFTDNISRQRGKVLDNENAQWLTRTSHTVNMNNVISVGKNGDFIMFLSPNKQCGILIGFCI